MSFMKKVTYGITVGAIFLIPFLALFVSNSLFFPFISGKNFAFRILVEVAFVGWALLMLLDAKYRPRFSWLAIIFGAFVLWMAVADAFAINPAKAFWSNYERMDGWVTLIHLLLLFLVMGSVFSVDKLWKKWWFTFLGVAAVVCVVGLLQVAHVFAIHQGGVRLDAEFGNSDYLACFLLFSIAISLWQALEAKVDSTSGKWLRYGLLAFTLIEVIVLFLTATRGAILGLIGAIGFGAVLWAIESGKATDQSVAKRKMARRAAGAALLVLLVAIGGFFLVRNTSFIQHDPTLSRLATISLKDGETRTRLVIWGMAIKGFEERPVTGWGQEGFNNIFNKYYNPSLYAQEPWFDRAHNMYLDWLTAGGAPGLLLFLALLGYGAWQLYRSKVSRAERIMLLSALAAYAFQGIFVFDNLFSYLPFVAILAMIYGANSKTVEKIQSWPVLGENDFMTFGLPFGVVAVALMIWFVNVPSIRAGTDLITAITPSSDPTSNLASFKQAFADGSFAQQEITEQLVTYAESLIVNQSVPSNIKQDAYSYAVQQMQALVAAVPGDARIRLEFALLYRSAGNFPEALAQIHTAEQLSPKKQIILLEEGIEQIESGNPAAGQAAFEKAYQQDPSFNDVAVYAAAGHILNGQLDAGKAILMQAFGTTTVDQQILLIAYYQAKDFPDLIAVAALQAKNQNYSVSSEFTLAEALSNAKHFREARALILQTVQAHPEAASQGQTILSQIPTTGGI